MAIYEIVQGSAIKKKFPHVDPDKFYIIDTERDVEIVAGPFDTIEQAQAALAELQRQNRPRPKIK